MRDRPGRRGLLGWPRCSAFPPRRRPAGAAAAPGMASSFPREPIAPRRRNLEKRVLAPIAPAWTRSMAAVLARIVDNLAVVTDAFPAPLVRRRRRSSGHHDNIEWTNGFWTGTPWRPGTGWPAAARTATAFFKEVRCAERQVRGFKHRIDHRINVDHHDLGFPLYSSGVARRRLEGDGRRNCARDAAIQAADALLDRFLPTAGIGQALGRSSQLGRGRPDDHRLQPEHLSPCSTAASRGHGGIREYAKAAGRHIAQAARHIVPTRRLDLPHLLRHGPGHRDARAAGDDFHQGFSDGSSCWAHGPERMGVSGIPAGPSPQRRSGPGRAAEPRGWPASALLNRLPDLSSTVALRDLVSADVPASRAARQSAAAIAACARWKPARALPLGDPDVTYEGRGPGHLQRPWASAYPSCSPRPRRGPASWPTRCISPCLSRASASARPASGATTSSSALAHDPCR
ncbi:hypothetical protein ACRAWD_03545 [Caulobacter segnis]